MSYDTEAFRRHAEAEAPAMTTTTPDFRALAIQALADDATLYPPAGWVAEFDALHAYIPAWALDGDAPNEVYRRAARSGKRPPSDGRAVSSYSAKLWSEVASWLRAHPEAPELVEKVAEIRTVWESRHDYTEDWAPYQRMIDANAAAHDVPY